MKTLSAIGRQFTRLVFLLMLVTAMNTDASLFGWGRTSWKEEVVLHDGQKIIVDRSQSRGGRREIGQSPPVKEHTVTFSPPSSSRIIRWTSEYGADVGRANFNLLALHIINSTPYLVIEPNLCLSYNKWGRPNPPYVVFKHDGKEWQRIPFSELPPEFKTINLIVNNGREEDIKALERKAGFVTAEDIRKINDSLTQPEYKAILREPLAPERIHQMCEERVLYKGSWILPNDPVARKFIDQQKK